MGNFSNYWDLHTLFTKLKNKLKSISDKIDNSVSLKTATGNPITLTDAANANAEELSMTIKPVQDLHGYSKPWPGGCGKNLLPMTVDGIKTLNSDVQWSGNASTINGVTVTILTDDGNNVTGVNFNGTATRNISVTFAQLIKGYGDILLNSGVNFSDGDSTWFAGWYQGGNAFYGRFFQKNDGSDAAKNIDSTSENLYVGVGIVSGYNIDLTFKPMMRLATETDATFAPYSNICPISGLTTGEVQTTNGEDTNTATITLGQTVYGGSVNFKTGEVTVTHGIADLGTLDWHKENTSSNYWRFYASFVGFKKVGTGELAGFICSHYKEVTGNQTWLGVNGISGNGLTSNSICVCDKTYSDVVAFTTAMSGVQLCYELATPTTLTLTPAELELLKSNNTITANGAEISIEYYPDNAIGALAGRVDDLDNTTSDMQEQIATKVEIQNNAGFHNSIYRGKFLGTEVTAEQYAAIANGTFDDMYIGDYWTIGGVNYRITHFNYWLGSGDVACTDNHILLTADTPLYNAKMNDSNVTTGAYVGSAMYTTNLAQAKTTINNAFGASHILNHREYLANAMSAATDPTYESAGSWYDSTVELMNERMVFGADVFHNVEVNGAIPYSYTIDKSQLALFALDPSRICNRAHWWLRCAVSAANFAHVNSYGSAHYNNASNASGVRPAFGIKA